MSVSIPCRCLGMLFWLFVHIFYLIGFRNRIQVMAHWFWTWLLNARDARLITGDSRLNIQIPQSAGFVADKPPDSNRTTVL